MAAFLAAASVGSTAFAGNAEPGVIRDIAINSQGEVSFLHNGQREPRPACHSAHAEMWVFSAATPQGQAKLSFLLTAFSLGKKISIRGSSGCAEWGDTEAVDVMFMIG
jgi:hypothetical protein